MNTQRLLECSFLRCAAVGPQDQGPGQGGWGRLLSSSSAAVAAVVAGIGHSDQGLSDSGACGDGALLSPWMLFVDRSSSHFSGTWGQRSSGLQRLTRTPREQSPLPPNPLCPAFSHVPVIMPKWELSVLRLHKISPYTSETDLSVLWDAFSQIVPVTPTDCTVNLKPHIYKVNRTLWMQFSESLPFVKEDSACSYHPAKQQMPLPDKVPSTCTFGQSGLNASQKSRQSQGAAQLVFSYKDSQISKATSKLRRVCQHPSTVSHTIFFHKINTCQMTNLETYTSVWHGCTFRCIICILQTIGISMTHSLKEGCVYNTGALHIHIWYCRWLLSRLLGHNILLSIGSSWNGNITQPSSSQNQLIRKYILGPLICKNKGWEEHMGVTSRGLLNRVGSHCMCITGTCWTMVGWSHVLHF